MVQTFLYLKIRCIIRNKSDIYFDVQDTVLVNMEKAKFFFRILPFMQLKGSIYKHDNSFYQENELLLPLDARRSNDRANVQT